MKRADRGHSGPEGTELSQLLSLHKGPEGSGFLGSDTTCGEKENGEVVLKKNKGLIESLWDECITHYSPTEQWTHRTTREAFWLNK